MYFVKDSITIVLLGDWNNFYIQPGWIAENIFEVQEMEIGINGQGQDFSVTYKNKDIVIAPTQGQIAFTALNNTPDNCELLIDYANKFLTGAFTPLLFAYGFNCDFIEENDESFAFVIDSMTDNQALIDSGFVIKDAKVTRHLWDNNGLIIFDSYLEGATLKLHFNQHYGDSVSKMPSITVEQSSVFLKSCRRIVQGLGYDIEEV